jgi:cytidylate kinase
MKPFVIALDGPAASGKSTVGRGVARALGLGYLDTGLLYRALTWLALQRGVHPADGAALANLVSQANLSVDPGSGTDARVLAEGADIADRLYQPEVDANVSAVSAHPAVRTALRPVQRAAVQPPGVVMAGRDIGTVIVPEAPLKVWLNASPEERARRRAQQRGQDHVQVLEQMTQRDLLDGSRKVAPILKPADAVEIDTDGVPPEQVVEHIVALVRERRR